MLSTKGPGGCKKRNKITTALKNKIYCESCGKAITTSSEKWKCGAQGVGEDGGWADPADITDRGGCGEWCHRKCMVETKCDMIALCSDECLENYECVDCDVCMGYF